MNFTTYQVLAFIGAVAGMAIVFGLGYAEGRRKAREHLTQALGNYREQIGHLRERAHRIQRDLDSCRLNAAQAIEALTEERDHQTEEVTTLRLRLTTANERITAMQAVSLNAEAAEDLAAMANKLSLAATQFGLMGATDQANSARALSLKARDLSQRYYAAQPAPQLEAVA
ncbi:hypothetical protein [Stutzerimonas nitrititolerans]|uniref:hypothetical protein n=1 Tax=Stutzerimonas nitrititolerans TaxID=2482751 RepID=UPI0028B0E7C1|nr:hypothetical protein [Stutzerimonas nitrititolerans]